MPTKTLLKIITALIFAVVVLVPLFYIKQGIYPFLFDKALFFQALVEVLFGLWLALAISDPRYRPRLRHSEPSEASPEKSEGPESGEESRGIAALRAPSLHSGLAFGSARNDGKALSCCNLLLLALAVFVAVLILTAFTGVDAWRSFFSTYERAYGVFGIMHMAAFAVVIASLRKEIPWKWLFAASIAASVAVGAIASVEFYFNNNLLIEQPRTRSGGTFGNPSFLAAYLLWHIFLSLYFLVGKYSRPSSRAERGIPEASASTGFFGLRLQNDAQLAFGWKRLPSRFLFSSAYLAFVILLEIFVLAFVAQSRGDILGLAAGVFVLLVLFALRPPVHSEPFGSVQGKLSRGISPVGEEAGFFGSRLRMTLSSRATYAVVLVLIVAAGAAFWLTRANDFWDKVPGVGRFREISLEAEGLQPRFIALRAAWTGFLERPILGWGPENFNIVFNKHYDPRALEANYQETRFDKPHNFVAEDLVTGGVALALAHLLFLGAFVFAAWRLGDKLLGQTIIAALAGYVVGNLFIFTTVGSDLPLFMFAGFLAGASREFTNDHELINNRHSELGEESRGIPRCTRDDAARVNSYIRKNSPIRAIKIWGLTVALAVSLTFAYFVNINTMRASYNLFYGFVTLARGDVSSGVSYFKKTLSIWSPWRWNFARDFAAAMSDFYFYNPELVQKEDVLDAISWMEYARDEHPLDAYNHYALVDMYNEVSDIDPQKFLASAEREAAIALKLSPNRQQVYFSLAKTKTLEGDYPKAIELAKYGLTLDEHVADGHFYYGLLLLAHGETDAGEAELKQAIRLGRKWKNFYEPLTIGNLLADAGRINDAIELYASSVVMADGKNKLEPRTKLGLAFYFAGRLKEAKSELQSVAAEFNFRTSPEFANLKPILDKLGVKY